MGIGDWGLGVAFPNRQSPLPNPLLEMALVAESFLAVKNPYNTKGPLLLCSIPPQSFGAGALRR